MKFYYTAIWLFILGIITIVDAAHPPSNPKIAAIVAQVKSAAKNPKICAKHCTPAKCYQDAIADACIANCPSQDKKSCTFVKKLKMRMLKYKEMHASQGAAPASSGSIANDASGGSSPTIPVKTGVAGNVRVCISIHPQGAQEGSISGGSKKQIKQQAKQEKKQIAQEKKQAKQQEKAIKNDSKQQAKQEKKQAKQQEKAAKHDLKQVAAQEKKAVKK